MTAAGSGSEQAEFLSASAALVTGAASGIGRATALALAKAGAAVLCFDRDDPEPVGAAIEAAGGVAGVVQGSITDEAAIAAAIVRCETELGPLRTIVNSAGIVEYGDFEKAQVDDFRSVLDVNVIGPLLILKHGLPVIRRAGGGSVTLFGSIAGRTGGILSGPAYGASKGGVHALVKWAANAYGKDGIRVNAIAPGPVETPMTAGQGYKTDRIPLGRLGVPRDLSAAALFLSSPAASWVTGQTLDVNGGVFMS